MTAPPGTPLFNLEVLQVELEEMPEAPVDPLTPGDLPPKIRQRILAEARPV